MFRVYELVSKGNTHLLIAAQDPWKIRVFLRRYVHIPVCLCDLSGQEKHFCMTDVSR